MRKNDDEKENYKMGGLVLEYLAKKKADSKSKERQFGKNITSLILNNVQKNNVECSSENQNTQALAAMKKIQVERMYIKRI